MNDIKLYRRRYIPNEKILLKDDRILYTDKEIIVTKWKVFRAKKEFNNGFSCYFLNENYKISKFFWDKKYIRTYCDIIETIYDESEKSYCFNDLLADVVIRENGFVEVLDLEEIADALDENLIDLNQAKTALRAVNKLLHSIYQGQFEKYLTKLDKFIKFD